MPPQKRTQYCGIIEPRMCQVRDSGRVVEPAAVGMPSNMIHSPLNPQSQRGNPRSPIPAGIRTRQREALIVLTGRATALEAVQCALQLQLR